MIVAHLVETYGTVEPRLRLRGGSMHTIRIAVALLLLAAVTTHNSGAESGIAPVNETKLYYEVAGDGPVLVLLHGGAVDSRAWDDQFHVFAEHYKTVRYDLRGAGKSARPEKPFSNSEDLYALLRFLKIDRAYLMGISRGGGIAYDFTLEHPEMVGALILVSSNLSNGPAAYSEMFERATEAGRLHGAAAAAQVWGNDPYQGPVRDEARPRVLEILEENLPRFRRFDGAPVVQQLSSSEIPRKERLSEIRVPAFVISGERDNADARANYEAWAKGIPRAKKLVVDDAAHLVNIDQPEIFNRAVLDFLGAL
jgi:pimeloyl-ACP methyl ester carboxylesterase